MMSFLQLQPKALIGQRNLLDLTLMPVTTLFIHPLLALHFLQLCSTWAVRLP